MALITLGYEISSGLRPAADMIPFVDDTDILFGELELLGMILVSRSSSVLNSKTVLHEVVLQTNAEGDNRFPSDETKKAATRSLYRSTLQLKLATHVVAREPVVS